MNIKEYIDSGVLESYALGICSSDEQREVETMCARYPELQAELTKVQEAINTYASAHSRAPQPVVKQRIFAEIEKLESRKGSKVVPLTSYRIAIAASVALFALSLVGNIIIYTRYEAAKKELTALAAEKNVLAANMIENQVRLTALGHDMNVLTNPAVKKVVLSGVAKSPQSMAMVYWNKNSKEVFVAVKKLPKPEAGKQYQLWAIVEGKPVDAGMIAMGEGDTSLHKMKDFAEPQAFAITLEKEGGRHAPTMSEMYVMGVVSL